MSEAFQKLNRLLGEHGDGESKLIVQTTVYPAGEDYSAQTYVLIEGDRPSLKFLAETILAHLDTDVCDLALHPEGAGSAHFHASSNAGIRLHLLPCEHDSMAKASSVKATEAIG